MKQVSVSRRLVFVGDDWITGLVTANLRIEPPSRSAIAPFHSSLKYFHFPDRSCHAIPSTLDWSPAASRHFCDFSWSFFIADQHGIKLLCYYYYYYFTTTTTTTTSTKWRRLCLYLCLFVCLSVCLSARLLARLWMDFDEIFAGCWLKL